MMEFVPRYNTYRSCHFSEAGGMASASVFLPGLVRFLFSLSKFPAEKN